jgi:hypothetical protein
MSDSQLPSGTFNEGVPDGLPPRIAIAIHLARLKAQQESAQRNQQPVQAPPPTLLQQAAGSFPGGLVQGYVVDRIRAVPEIISNSPVPRRALKAPRAAAGLLDSVAPGNPASQVLNAVYHGGNDLLDRTQQGLDAENAFYENARQGAGRTGFDTARMLGGLASLVTEPELFADNPGLLNNLGKLTSLTHGILLGNQMSDWMDQNTQPIRNGGAGW